ncbi:glycosyltransferase [Bacillus sp. FJAT-49711]|uniref:glycosyltransferase n=1 Tax=Bacillus sp. FJAT-49711 TaxID=2833585 RepID=UPI001BC90EE6|nr:glycosyltransferase [Bacillus sp. FJAT-49711]
MSQNTPIILINSLDVVRGGVTKAVLTRANTLAKKFDNVFIFTFLIQHNHENIIKKLYQKGLLDPKVKVMNLFEGIKPQGKRIKIKKSELKTKERGLVEIRDKKQAQLSYRYYKDGLYVKYKRFTNDGRLVFIDYMDESRQRIKRIELDSRGRVTCIKHMDITLNKPRLERYFDKKGKCYLSVWINPKTGEESKIIIFDKQPKEFRSLVEFQRQWLDGELLNIENPVIMVDRRQLDSLAMKVKNKDAKKIAVIHNNHLKAPYTFGSEVKKQYDELFNNLQSIDKVVLLTEEQQNDIESLYKVSENKFSVIPHPAKQVNQSVEKDFKEQYNSNLAVTLARYESQKRLDLAIRAFKLVVDKIPTAEYHIYGFGKLEGELKRLIKELNLENNIKLKGFTSEANFIYKSAACSILTSDFEGFGMVLTESLASGTPVVSFDLKYGPKDIIRDGIDGYLVEKGNLKDLAEKIIKIMENPKLRQELAKNALDINRRFSVEGYANNWVDLLNGI